MAKVSIQWAKLEFATSERSGGFSARISLGPCLGFRFKGLGFQGLE